MSYQPNPILAEVLGRLEPDKREAFAEALVEGIGVVAQAKAEADYGKLLSRYYHGPVVTLDDGHPWRVTWYDGDHDDSVGVYVFLDDVLDGVNIDAMMAERQAREAEEARRLAEMRERQEALKASAKAKILAAGLTLEEQVALGVNAYMVR